MSANITTNLLYVVEVIEELGLNIIVLLNLKAMVFPVVVRGCESWTIKKAEH